ncbi:hypothetical protein [Oryzobacter terrae]|uniref:hypothetical protein n=1 Tax=Oryzobacter terrae TaxID=1620385 RepID=UPI00366D383D
MDASIRELIRELEAVEDRLQELHDAVDCPEGRSWTAAEVARLARREERILASLRDWRITSLGVRGVSTSRPSRR